MKNLTEEESQWALSATLKDFSSYWGAAKSNPFRKKILQRYFGAKQRCNNPKNKLYSRYGARGIKVELTKEEFVTWFLKEYKLFFKKHGLETPSLSRIDHNKNYTLNNIELGTVSENSREMYSRVGNNSAKGTVIDEIQALVCHTFKNRKMLAKHYKVSYTAIAHIHLGISRKHLYNCVVKGM